MLFNRSVVYRVTILALLICMSCTKKSMPPDQWKELLQKPLIIGASVSADYNSLSPGKRLALRYTASENIRSVAQGGRKGVDTLAALQESDLSGRTIVLGLDLFFWDSTLPSADESIKALQNFIQKLQSKNIPVVLGEIPELLAGRQPGRPALNASLHAQCEKYPRCAVMPFDDLHRQLMRDGFLVMKGRRLGLMDIVPDGLHLSDDASEDLADRLQNIVASVAASI
jgi:hypothetical protein